MQSIDIMAHAKINLTLDVLARRTDGYHEVEMVMQLIDLHDNIKITRGGTDIKVSGDSGEIPLNKENIVYKAAIALFNAVGSNEGCHINITKKIPVAAGLAGGSADAAATLVGLNQLMNLGQSQRQLMEVGAKVGSDVPFCIIGGTALAIGRGEKVKPLPGLPKLWLVLAKPDIGVSTAMIYKNFDAKKAYIRPNTSAIIEALEQKNIKQIKKNMVNVLESVTLPMHPEVKNIKENMCKLGLKYPLMSGSGPTVFSFVDSEEQARYVAKRLQQNNSVVIVTHTA